MQFSDYCSCNENPKIKITFLHPSVFCSNANITLSLVWCGVYFPLCSSKTIFTVINHSDPDKAKFKPRLLWWCDPFNGTCVPTDNTPLSLLAWDGPRGEITQMSWPAWCRKEKRDLANTWLILYCLAELHHFDKPDFCSIRAVCSIWGTILLDSWEML